MRYLKFYRYLLPFWQREILILFLSSITVILGLVNPYLTKLIIDKAYANKDLKLFIILIAIGGFVFIFNGVINGVSNYLSRYIKLRINFDLNKNFFQRFQSLSYGFFQDSSTGENIYKINYDIERVAVLITDTLPQLIFLSLKSLFILVMVFYLNWKMALFALVLMPFLYPVPYYFTKQMKKILKMWIEISQGIFKQLQEILTHMYLIKAFGKEGFEKRHYIRSLIKKIRADLKSTRLEITGSFANSLANRIISGLIIFYGGFQLIKGQMTLGTLSAITIYISQLSGLQNSFAQFFQQISLGLVSYERLEAILDIQHRFIEDKHAKEIKFPEGKIVFRNITFGYSPEKMVAENLNFCIEGGSHIALVGPSGCGKTTIVNLILRLYNLKNGEILIDGYNIKHIEYKSFYRQVGVVLQEPYLWNDTIENNISYGKELANFKEVVDAARISCIEDFINGLPKGYKTIIGENACKISEGQKQRIALARAIIKKPRILILDEALSSVDAEVEDRIIDNITDLLNYSTVVIISHRLSTIRKMNLVYFLSGFDKIVIGTHDELLKNNPGYHNYLPLKVL